MSKSVYFFGDGRADGSASMTSLLGGKGANLAEMIHIGIPVPPGLTITTEVCNTFFTSGGVTAAIRDEVMASLREVERVVGRKLGDAEKPLLVSVRSGARASMLG